MNRMTCCHCQGSIAMPPPSMAGAVYDCPHCRRRFRFTGAGAIPPPPEPAAVSWGVAPAPPEVKSTFDVYSGMKLFFLSMVALVAV